MRIWTKDELNMYLNTQRKPPDLGPESFGISDSIVVSGSSIATKKCAAEALTHRLRFAWKSYAAIRPQLQMFDQPLRLRLQLLDAVVLPSLMLGLQRVWLCRPERGRIRAFQRTVVARCIRLFPRPDETWEQFFRRRERVTTKWITVAPRGRWGQLQRYRFLTFFGHAARLSDDHLLGDVLRWRSDSWWRDYKSRHAKRGGAAGRRPANMGNAMQTESRIQDLYAEYILQPTGQAMLESFRGQPRYSLLERPGFPQRSIQKVVAMGCFIFDITDGAQEEPYGGADRSRGFRVIATRCCSESKRACTAPLLHRPAKRDDTCGRGQIRSDCFF